MLDRIGKILKDEDTVATYKIEEKGFVVCMVNKVRKNPGPAMLWSCKAQPDASR